ncbi:hypothetical protein LB505_004447 [Fusarium chuoi]|nr:hypothetical protein LB505_004447 [Fusarium chuoi]
MQFDNKLPSDSTIPKEQLKPDVLVFATGYTRDFPFLDNDYPTVAQTNIREIYKEGDVTLGYIGFVRPSIGAIPPLAELQAQLTSTLRRYLLSETQMLLGLMTSTIVFIPEATTVSMKPSELLTTRAMLTSSLSTLVPHPRPVRS